MLKPISCVVLSTLAWGSFAPLCWAVPIASVPNPRRTNGGWVTDMAEMLSPETEATLNREISNLEAKNSSEIAVVTVPDISPTTNAKAYATELFNTWGIGKRGKNNGVLFLVSKADRRVEIVTGKGLTRILPDNKVSTILRQDVTPQFKQGQFDKGVLAGTNSIITQVEQFDSLTTSSTSPENFWIPAVGGVAAGAAVVSGIVRYRRRSRRVFSEQDAITVNPVGQSRVNNFRFSGRNEFDRPTRCAKCSSPMEPISSETLAQHLSRPQQVAQQMGNVKFIGWHCPTCYPNEFSQFHLRAYVLLQGLETCATCQELTIEVVDRVVEPATHTNLGKRQITRSCYCCLSEDVCWETIPVLTTTSSDSSSDHSWSSSDSSSSSSSSSWSSSDSGSSWSSSDSSSSSSDFGGGSSGGGSGDSW